MKLNVCIRLVKLCAPRYRNVNTCSFLRLHFLSFNFFLLYVISLHQLHANVVLILVTTTIITELKAISQMQHKNEEEKILRTRTAVICFVVRFGFSLSANYNMVVIFLYFECGQRIFIFSTRMPINCGFKSLI